MYLFSQIQHLLLGFCLLMTKQSCFINCPVQFSHSIVSDSSRPQELQHNRPPCPSPSLAQSHVLWVSDAIQPPHPLSSSFPLLPSLFPSIRVSSKESDLCIRWSKDWSFSFSISPSNEYSGLISFRINWFDLLAVFFSFWNILY